jgi:hypothetical protein
MVPRAVTLKGVGIGVTGASSSASFAIRNSSKSGNLIGSIGVISIDPPTSTFSITPGGAFSIPPKGSQLETVTMVPGGITNTAAARITSNDRINPSLTVTFKGAGFAGKLSVPSVFQFSAPVGQPTEEDLQIKNIGKGALSGRWSPVVSSVYSIAGGSFVALQPKATATIRIFFTPSIKGRAQTGSLMISVDAPGTGAKNVTLKGVGK